MLPNPLLRKLVQMSEEVLPPIQVPLILGNDFFILTQQDVRKIEESRVYTLSRVLPNGDLKIINSLHAGDWLQEPFSKGCDTQCQQMLNSLWEFLNYKSQISQQTQAQSAPQPMDVSVPNEHAASISHQLEWNKCINISPPFPLHYSHGTSTTEIDYNPEMKITTCKTCNHLKTCPDCKNQLRYFDKSTSMDEVRNVCNKKQTEILDARQQLKKKKLKFSFT